ncbi:MAG: DUF1636 domain-containing protein [Bosea sp.]|nr:DUF1636 domain-containing protein [Bosea sp. (in: a-proteobacteria)]
MSVGQQLVDEAIGLSRGVLSVCFRCRPEGWKGEDTERPGVRLAEAIEAEAQKRGLDLTLLRDVRCMSQCKRPCVIAFSGQGKFTYVFGDLDPECHASDILDAFELYASRADGFMERFERPEVMRAGVLGRVPPLGDAARLVEPRPAAFDKNPNTPVPAPDAAGFRQTT